MAAISGKPPLIVIPEVEGWQGWVVLGLVGFMLLALLAELAPPHLVMIGTLIICLSLSIIDLTAAFHGFSDQAVLSVAVLFVVAKGIEMSGGLEYLTSVLFKAPNKSKSIRLGSRPSRTEGSIVWVLLKFCVPVAIFSAFLANIPLVAMMIPPILEFANKVKMAPSKMLIPLSYAANLGGTMTLIGASTNLMVLSMTAQKLPDLHMSLFEIGVVGLPITFAGLFYIIAFSGKLLPNRVSTHSTTMATREYNILLAIKENSKLAHRSIEWSGLGCQPGLHLVAITRDIETILDPAPEVVLQPKDRLHFVGVIDSVLLLTQVYGLKLTEDEGQGEVDLNQLKATQVVVEAVIASGSSMVHERIADLQCRTRFNSTIAAIHRHRKRLTSLIGEIRVEAGDCLLMVADTFDFVTKHRTNSHFALVSQLPGFKPLNRKKASIASILALSMVVASGVGMNLLMCALLSSVGLLLTRCLTPQDAMEAIELPVIIMIAAAFGIAEAMVESGAATILAKALMGLAGKSMFGLISCTYIATMLFSLAITNSAAVTIMFPVALAAANHQALDFRPFAYTLMMAASAGFMTPTACPTNLMVCSPGNYKFSDYIHYGGPLQVFLLLVTVGVTMTLKFWYIWAIVIFAITCGTIPLIASHKSTHSMPLDDGIVVRDARSQDGQHDNESPNVALNVGRELMMAPGHDNKETVIRRMSQTTIPPTTSSSMTSFPSMFSSSFPPPYRLEDSHTSSSSSSTGPNQTKKDFSSSSFPPPYRLDESPILTFPSICTSLSGKAAQFIYDSKPNSFESIAPSSFWHAQTTSVTIPAIPAMVAPLALQETNPQCSHNSLTTPIPQIMPFGTKVASQESQTKLDIQPYWARQPLVQTFSSRVPFYSPESQSMRMPSKIASSSSSADVVQPLDENVDSSLLQPLDGNVDSSLLQPLDGNVDSSLLQPLDGNVDSSFLQPMDVNVDSSFLQSLDFNEESSFLQPLDINVASNFLQPLDFNVASSFLQPLDGVVDSSFLQPLDDNVDSFTDVNISEEISNSNNIGPMFPDTSNGPVPSTSVAPLTSGESSETGPVGLLSKILRPSFSALISGGGELQSQPTTSPSNTKRPFAIIPGGGELSGELQSQPTTTLSNTERPSIFEVGGGSAQTSPRRASKRVSTYVRSPNRSSRRASKAAGRKKSKSPRSPRSGQGSPWASSQASPTRIASNEDNVTGGISNLLATRRLSLLNDTSAFADNTSVIDH